MRYFVLPSWGMAYSIHDHISYILEASSKRSNDFSLIGRQPNETWQFKWKKLTVLKFKSKLNSKFILKRGKTIKIMKRSKNRRGITQVKTLFFTYKQKLSIYYDNKEIHAKNIVSACAVRSEHHIDMIILNAKSIGKEHSASSSLSHLSISFFLRFNKEVHKEPLRQACNQKIFRAGEVSGN